MPWREYVDPDTGQVWRTDAPVGGDDSSYNYLPGGIPPTPPAAVRPTVGFGGGGQYAGGTYGLSEAAQAQQLALLVRKLEELELPTLDLQRRNQLLQEIQQLTAATGYVDRNLWSRLQGGGGMGGGNTANLSNDAALDYIWQQRPDLEGFYRNNGWDVSTPEARRRAVQNWITQGDPANRGQTPQQVASRLGYSGGGGGQGGGSSVRQQMMDWDQAFHTRNNGAAPTAEQRAQRLAQITGMTPDQAMAMEQRRTQWMQLTGGSGEQGIGQYYPSDAEFNSWQQQIAPERTLDRQRFEDTLGENRRQFDASQRQQGQQFWGGLLASKSGPRDYWTYNMMQANVPESARWGDMRSLANAMPYSGAMTPGNNSWEQTFAEWMGQQRSGATDTRQPPSGGGQQPTPMPVTGLGNTTPGQAPTGGANPNERYEAMVRAYQTGAGQRGTGVMTPGGSDPYEGRQMTDVDRAYNQAYQQAQLATNGGTDDMFRSAPTGWQPGQAVVVNQRGRPYTGTDGNQLGNSYQNSLQQQGNPQNRGTAARQTGVLPGEPNGLDWRGTFTQPNTLDPRTWNRMRESQRDMLGGQWSSFGVDPRDAEQQMRRSWAGGQANTRTRWM